ncbi:DUF1616 domain-containing protein [Halorientalis regularis]|uniref:Uncharacterized membrane protein n=1 Tax=Halorientalis regularis TaxID=660518 RepID=A0A1G7T1U6_9EURY|nr:DUF1616 domain-containing protein [Halorientalis regularis]SDG29316.1 Uncharacterized membrane protein [Halorientalis regularis]
MATGDRLRLLLPRQIRELPADLGAALAVLLVTDLFVLVPVLNETPLRVVLGLPLVLFVPGYVFIAALFPEAGESPADSESDPDATDSESSGIDGIERVALSFGLSIAIVPLIGLVLNFTPWGIRLVPILIGLNGFTLAATAIAARRRWALPESERFSAPYREWVVAGKAELLEPDGRADLALNVLLVLSVMLAFGSVAYAVTVPNQGERFTEFYLLTENEDGELVADDYPTEFTVGQSKPVVVGIGNHEHGTVEYTVVSMLQRVETSNNSTRVMEQRELGRFSATVEDNKTVHRTRQIEPTMTGQRLRLAYLLYRDSPPAEPSVSNAYRETHLWVNVSAG